MGIFQISCWFHGTFHGGLMDVLVIWEDHEKIIPIGDDEIRNTAHF